MVKHCAGSSGVGLSGEGADAWDAAVAATPNGKEW